jgi:type IV pilus assembly protein PilN
LIKINLVREGRAVRGAGGAPAASAAQGGAGIPGNVNNILAGGLAVLGLLLAGGYWFLAKRNLADAQERLAQRQAEAQKLESVIKQVEDFQHQKDNLQKRIDLINQLKQNQKGPVRIMDQISRDLPDLVWLDKMTIDAGKVTINGRGLNPNAIALFVGNIKNDPYFEEPNVSTVSQTSVVPLVYTFDMDFGFAYQPKTAAGAAGAGTTTTGTAGSTTTTGTAKK